MKRTENGPKTPEALRDSRLFYDIATNPRRFQAILPDFARHIATQEFHLENHTEDLIQARKMLTGLWKHGSSDLLFLSTTQYARANNWWSEKPGRLKDKSVFQKPKHYYEFTGDEKKEWVDFIKSNKRESRDNALLSILRMILTRCIPERNLSNQIRYQLALRIFPDLNNRDAKRLGVFTAAEARKLAVG